jgi:hypothetical protein
MADLHNKQNPQLKNEQNQREEYKAGDAGYFNLI